MLMYKSRYVIATSLMLAACLTTPTAFAAPMTFNTALPISDDEVIIRQQVHYVHMSDQLGSLSRDAKVWKSITAAGYGLSPRLAVFGVVPIVSKNVNIGSNHIKNSGLADIKLFARYQICQKDGRGQTTRIAPFFGLNLPTGKLGKTSDGSTDFFGGVIYTHNTSHWNFDAQAKYTANSKHKLLQRGDETALDTSMQYRLNSPDINVKAGGFLLAGIEGSYVHTDRDRIAGVHNANSGGTMVYLSPTLQYITKRVVGELAVKIPVVKDLNGTALEPDITVIASTRLNF